MMGTRIGHPFYTNFTPVQTPFPGPFTQVQTPQWGYGSAYPASHRRPQAQGEGPNDVEDTAAEEAFTPASHNMNNNASFGAHPFVPLFYPVPVHAPSPYTAFTPHQPHHPFPTAHNSPFHPSGHLHSGIPAPPTDPRFTAGRSFNQTPHVHGPPPPSAPPPYRPRSTPHQPVHRNLPNRQFTPHAQPVHIRVHGFIDDFMGHESNKHGAHSFDYSIARPPTPPPTPFASNTPATATPFSFRRQSLTPQIQGSRHGISNLLEFDLGAYPFIDWVISQDLSFAREWVRARPSGGRCQSVRFGANAVSPPVHRLSIHPREDNSPLGQAMRRWGEIQVQRFDRFITVGDVLHAIWEYFQVALTPADQRNIASESMGFVNKVEEWHWKRCIGRDIHRRCDTLLYSLRFAGMEIDYNFDVRSVLYLTLGNV